LAKEINEDGFNYGGSYDTYKRVIYLVNNGRKSDHLAIAAFHHEFSSLLLTKHTIVLNSWIRCNPYNFRYLTGINRDEIFKVYNTTTLVGTEDDYENGFIDSYGQTNFENDFNEYAAMIFTHPQKFKKIMNRYPRVRGKFLIFQNFYYKINPIFTEEYLLGGKQTAASRINENEQ
jgi:hypothetical protein